MKSLKQQRAWRAFVCRRYHRLPFVACPLLALVAQQFVLQDCSAPRIRFTQAVSRKEFANGFIAALPVLARPPRFATSHDRQPQCSIER